MTNPDRITKGMYWDRAWSLVSGCTHVSPGCDNCWSAKETHMRANNPNQKVKARNEELTEKGYFNGQIRLNHEFLDLPLRVKKPTVWAVWNDLFHEDVPFDFVEEVWGYMLLAKQHTFMILTKRPERMKQFVEWHIKEFYDGNVNAYIKSHGHIWLGVTAENQKAADERIWQLCKTPAALRYISFEPLLGDIKLSYLTVKIKWAGGEERGGRNYRTVLSMIDWGICGGESGPGARPMHPDWARSLRDQCQAAGVAFFLKQMHINGKLVKMPELDGKQWKKMPNVKR